jgi:hypothetical protein
MPHFVTILSFDEKNKVHFSQMAKILFCLNISFFVPFPLSISSNIFQQYNTKSSFMLMPLLLALVAGFIVVVNAGGSIPPQLTLGESPSSPIIPASWSLTNDNSMIQSNSCIIMTSPAFGGVYPSGSSLAIRWLLNNDAAVAAALANSTYQISVSLVDNYLNTSTLIASGLDPYSSVYLWKIPETSLFSRRAYIVVSVAQGNVTTKSYSICDATPQVVGPFTILSRQQPSFFITGPDSGTGQNNTDLGNKNGTGIGLLSSIPMGRFFYNVVRKK